MRKLNLCLIASVLTTAATGVSAQSRLPPCPGSFNAATWTICSGAHTWPDGGRYIGGWENGKFNGQGSMTFPDGEKYAGVWKDGKRYAGEYRDGKSKSVRPRESDHLVITKAVGLRPIGELPSPAGDELRLWIFTHTVTHPMLVLREGPAGVSGEFVIWWGEVYGQRADDPAGRAYDRSGFIRNNNKVQRGFIKSRWNCAKHAVAALFEACRVSLQRQPDWSRLLRALEREGVWDLPDGSTLPRDVPNPVPDGVSLLVEVRRGGKARSYSYVNPRHIPGPEARSVERIFSLFAEFERSL